MNKKELIEFLEKKITLDIGDEVYDSLNEYKTEINDIHIHTRPEGIEIDYLLASDNQLHESKYLIKLTPANAEVVENYITTKEKPKKLISKK